MRARPIVALALALSIAGICCGPSRARHAAPDGAPEPPEGEGWFCAHAITPHEVSWCKRERSACDKVRAKMIKAKEAFPVVPERIPATSRVRPESAPVAGPGGGDDVEGEGGGDDAAPSSEIPEAPSGNALESQSICSIDPSACPSRSYGDSVPTYSSCGARSSAFCSAYYHEYNSYRRDKDNEWRHFCAETKEDCEAWRALWHIHLVKRPCEPVP
ncbi:hypothetical protein [Polyangium sp. 6x1]|uniref:hypothetical protein n=1 Tax=Polyangium sp. 6x1 TaxID=3042689 RepID=UPI0024822C49|nr:hypothetical protein [Polyangium sp. 6x1]MDI1449760.1 hypothetical protein [Polyangium sp. 6x1]